MSGFIKMHRKILDHWLGTSPEYLGAWGLLLMKAYWKDKQVVYKGHVFTIKRGEIWASSHYLAEEWGWSPSKVQRFIRLLVKENMLVRRRVDAGQVLLSVVNFDKFQSYNGTGDATVTQGGRDLDATVTIKEERKEGKEEDSHTTREMPVYGLQPEIFAMWGKVLTITDQQERARWEGIFGGSVQLDISLAGFTPDDEYKWGNSLEKHARHYLSNKAANVNRGKELTKRQSLAEKFR